MRTHLEFRSSAFPPYPGEDEKVKPGLYGKRLAEFTVEALSRAGFKPDEPCPEDWGWCITIQNKEFGLWVGCGHHEEYPDGFLCFIEPSKPFGGIQKPFFELLGTPPEDKRHVVLEGGHLPPQYSDMVREILGWTDARMGTVRR